MLIDQSDILILITLAHRTDIIGTASQSLIFISMVFHIYAVYNCFLFSML